ncbi:MAG: chemotaxis response regulator protein-glutamate methylesterase [Bacillota bacterium]|nr:chemotaxis response regulator protein-glutamate methylesterase [Bacillota bacterium]
MEPPIRVLVVDDSAFFRRLIGEVLTKDPSLRVAGVARDGHDAVEKVKILRPDVVTLDVNMPELNGLEALRQIMRETPTPVVMLSSLTVEGAEETIQALQDGAVDFLCKPALTQVDGAWQQEVIAKVKVAARANLGRPGAARVHGAGAAASGRRRAGGARIVAIGTSTGGPRALQEVIPRLPRDLPVGVLVVQHMPPGFTRTLAQRLDACSSLRVKEAEHGEPIRPGTVYLAPGAYHLRVGLRGEIALGQDPPIASLRPSVDALFESVAEVYGAGTVAAVLTGMGNDGTRGAGLIKRAGGWVVAEDQSTCVVYGMPRSVIEEGYADRVVPLGEVADELVRAVTPERFTGGSSFPDLSSQGGQGRPEGR